jgi:hypothetical protein
MSQSEVMMEKGPQPILDLEWKRQLLVVILLNQEGSM